MDRLISEQEALDVIASWFESTEQQRILQGRIKAIPSAEPCEDAISREDVINLKWQGEASKEFLEGYANAIEDARVLPSVKPQEPREVLYSGDGYADGEMVYDMAECPNCGYEYKDGDKDWGLSFCPNCGQKLNWESEDEE